MESLKITARDYQNGMLTDREFLSRIINIIAELYSATPETANFSGPVVALADKLAGQAGD